MKGILCHLSPTDRDRVIAALTEGLSTVPNLAFAYLYGSFLEDLPFHDVDVGIYFASGNAPASWREEAELATSLSERTGCPVDVRVLNEAPLGFLHRVLRGRLLVARDEELLERALEDTARRYLDAGPLLRRSIREAFGS